METPRTPTVSRRSFIKIGTIGGLALASSQLALPQRAFADNNLLFEENLQEEVIFSAHPDMNAQELVALHDKHLKDEVAQVISEAMAEDERLGLKTSSRPKYTTQYGSKTYKWTPWKTVPGQPRKGTKIEGGGTIHVSGSSGGTVSCSWGFGTPYGTLGISYTIGKYLEAGGYEVPIKGNGYYLAQHRKQYLCQPYVVYVTKNGKKSVYRRALISTYERQGFRAVKC